MKATAGAYPNFKMEKQSVGKTKSGKDSSKSLYEAQFGNGRYQYDLTSGWVPRRRKGWLTSADRAYAKESEKGSALTYSYLTGTDGKKRRVYRLKGYQDYRGWHADKPNDQKSYRHSGGTFGWYAGSPMAKEILEQEGRSFSGEPGKDYRSVDIPEGHIQKIEYNVNTYMMRVTFGGKGGPNGTASREDVCLFYPVPDEVAGTLLVHAESKTTRGNYTTGRKRPKHLVGIEFWNLMRIRGQRYGAKIPFEYTKHGASKPKNRGDRFKVDLNRNNYKAVTGKEPPASLGENDTATVVVNGSEHEQYLRIMGGNTSGSTALPDTGKPAQDKPYEDEAVHTNAGVVKRSNIDDDTNPLKGKKWHKSDMIAYVDSDKFTSTKQREQYAKYIRHGQYVRAWNLLKQSSYIEARPSGGNVSRKHAGPRDVFVYDDDNE